MRWRDESLFSGIRSARRVFWPLFDTSAYNNMYDARRSRACQRKKRFRLLKPRDTENCFSSLVSWVVKRGTIENPLCTQTDRHARGKGMARGPNWSLAARSVYYWLLISPSEGNGSHFARDEGAEWKVIRLRSIAMTRAVFRIDRRCTLGDVLECEFGLN